LVIIPNQFGPISKPEMPHKTSDQYPLKELGSVFYNSI
jgi:hypothetical protein